MSQLCHEHKCLLKRCDPFLFPTHDEDWTVHGNLGKVQGTLTLAHLTAYLMVRHTLAFSCPGVSEGTQVCGTISLIREYFYA